MTEPERLFDCSIEPVERMILQTGRDVVASAEARAQTLRALGLLESLSERNSGHSKVASLAKRRARILLAALSVSTLVAAMPLGYWAIKSAFPAATARPPLAAADARQLGTSQLGARQELPSQPPASSELTHRETRPDSAQATGDVARDVLPDEGVRAAVEGPRVTRSMEPRAVAGNLLTLELAALDSARKKLNSGDALGALSQLEGYDRDFPRPRLALEAEVLRIFAYDSAGQTALAKKRAKAFVARHPKGVLTARVKRYLGQ